MEVSNHKLSDFLSMASIAKMLVSTIGTETNVNAAVGAGAVAARNNQSKYSLYVFVKPVVMGIAGQRVMLSTNPGIPPTTSRPIRADNLEIEDMECILRPSQTLYAEAFVAATRLYVASLSLNTRILYEYM